MPPCFLSWEVKLIPIGLERLLGAELLENLLHASEILKKCNLGIGIAAVIENADCPSIARLLNRLEHRRLMPPLAKRQNFWSRAVIHPVEIQAKEVWLHQFQRLFKIRDVSVGVVQVVNNAYMSGVVMRSEMLAHRHEIRRFATPAAVIIET